MARSVVTSSKDRTTGSFRILVVEDDERLQELYGKVLDVFGFRFVDIVGDGQEAVDKMSEAALPYDLVILDWNLPGEKNGMDVLNFIRYESRRAYSAVLISTGMAQIRHVEEARDSGMTDFLAKPFTVEQLKDKLMRIFRDPRSFVKSVWYTGPCRRRRNIGPPGGEERRKAIA